jgi:hypothetical protein
MKNQSMLSKSLINFLILALILSMFSGVSFAATETGTITGVVTDLATGKPMSKVCVNVFSGVYSPSNPVSGKLVGVACTDSSGKYTFSKVPAGNYYYSATKPGYVENDINPTENNMTAGAILNGNIVMFHNVIYGTVIDNAGNPLKGTTVTVTNSKLSSTTNEYGYFEIYNAPTGKKTLTITEPGYDDLVSGPYDIENGYATNTNDLSLSPKSNVTGFGTITGVVNDLGTGKPLPGVTVDIYAGTASDTEAPTEAPIATIITDSSGSYRSNKVPAGDFFIIASMNGYVRYWLNSSYPATAERTVTLDTIDMFLRGIHGVIRDTNGNPVGNATVTIQGTTLTTTTDENGSYEFMNPPSGSQMLIITKPGYQELIAGKFDISDGTITNIADLSLTASPDVKVKPAFNSNAVDADKVNEAVNKALNTSTSKSFTDVPATIWSVKAIKLASRIGFVKGFSDGSFHPNAPVTRAEFTVMLVTALQLDTNINGSSYTDTKKHWARAVIEALSKAGYVDHYGEGSSYGPFKPDNNITRAQATVFLCLFTNLNLYFGPPLFTDIKGTPAEEPINRLASVGILTGDHSKFFPNATVTRAEAVTMILRFLTEHLDLNLDV